MALIRYKNLSIWWMPWKINANLQFVCRLQKSSVYKSFALCLRWNHPGNVHLLRSYNATIKLRATLYANFCIYSMKYQESEKIFYTKRAQCKPKSTTYLYKHIWANLLCIKRLHRTAYVCTSTPRGAVRATVGNKSRGIFKLHFDIDTEITSNTYTKGIWSCWAKTCSILEKIRKCTFVHVSILTWTHFCQR